MQGSVQVPQRAIASTVGAGDAFAAGVLHGLHEGFGIGQILRDGVAVAAACLRGTGGSDAILPLAQCRELALAHGFRTLGGAA
jgi:sugar/nucleoside kinase (ribokinase family)